MRGSSLHMCVWGVFCFGILLSWEFVKQCLVILPGGVKKTRSPQLQLYVLIHKSLLRFKGLDSLFLVKNGGPIYLNTGWRHSQAEPERELSV